MERDDPRANAAFPVTRYSAIERIRAADPDARRTAFGDLVDGYWKPVYKHLRLTWRLDPDDARDFTQGFFAEAFQKAWLERFEPGKAKFRTFVRVCADRFVMNTRQSAARLKRGGGVQTLSLDFDGAEREVSSRVPASATPEPEELFHQEFVRALFDRVVSELRREYEGKDRPVHFLLFERYDLDPVDGVSYALLAKEFGLTATQVTNTLAQVRRRFRERALEDLRGLCGTDEEFRREARELFGMDIT
jgi:DNA-directed RNA polymerase specialized sigma24 family protein